MGGKSISGLFTKPVQAEFNTEPMIAAGAKFSLALKSDGTVWAWGYNNEGQLGSGTNETRKNTPVQVLGSGDNGFLNLLQSQSSIILNITSPEANTNYSEVDNRNIITVSGTVAGKDNCKVTATLEK